MATSSGTCLRQNRRLRLFRTWRGGGSLAVLSPTPPVRPSRPPSEMATDPLGTGFNGDFSMDFASLIPGCNPIHGGVNYLNTNCFTPPTAPASLPLATTANPYGCAPAVSLPPRLPGAGGRRVSSSARTSWQHTPEPILWPGHHHGGLLDFQEHARTEDLETFETCSSARSSSTS